jgi:hypothetical protein
MNNKSSKKPVVRDIPKFGSTKCFCDDGNLFKVKNLIHEADLWVLFCAALSLLTSVNQMQCKCTQMKI